MLGQRQAGPEGGLAAVHAHGLCHLRCRRRRQGGQHQPQKKQGSLRGGGHGSRHERQGSGGCTHRRSSRGGKRRRGRPSTHQGRGSLLAHLRAAHVTLQLPESGLQGRTARGPLEGWPSARAEGWVVSAAGLASCQLAAAHKRCDQWERGRGQRAVGSCVCLQLPNHPHAARMIVAFKWAQPPAGIARRPAQAARGQQPLPRRVRCRPLTPS